jgi:hypothetical protein
MIIYGKKQAKAEKKIYQQATHSRITALNLLQYFPGISFFSTDVPDQSIGECLVMWVSHLMLNQYFGKLFMPTKLRNGECGLTL